MLGLTLTPPGAGASTPTRKLIELPMPELGQGEVLVEVHYAALNYIDLETTKGEHNGSLRKSLKRHPVISGIEMAGVVQNDGGRFRKGDKVFGYTNIFKGPFYHAQYITAPEKNLALVPENSSMEAATAIIGGALTSINAFERRAELQPGTQVLVTGATGSVGVTALQLASHHGAVVTAVCHSTQAEFAKSQGAVEVHAYDLGEMPDPAQQFDLVFDTAPSLSFSTATPYLKSNGRYISTMPHLDLTCWLKSIVSRRKWGFLLEYDTDVNRMERLHSLISEEAFTPVIERIYGFEQIDTAFESQLKAGKRGKILIDFRNSELDHSVSK